jgi:glycosyltransferase involved in cell wall biosynthesis
MDGFAVSVIIPVYNAARFLICAVHSALQQPEVGEVVLVDDGSTDGSFSVAEKLRDANPGKVFLFTHAGGCNKGPGETRNFGLEKSRFPFVAFLDADDWYLPGYFKYDQEAFARDPDLGMVRHPLGNGWDPSDEAQKWFVEYTGKSRAHAKLYSWVENPDPGAYFSSLYPLGDVSSGIADTLTIRKIFLQAVGGFPPRDWAEDVAVHLKLAAIGTVAFSDMGEPLAMRRIHADNLSRRKAGELSFRVDAMGATLLDLADFAIERRLTWAKKAALHKGWLKFAPLYTRYHSYDMLRKWPWALLDPRLAYLYARTYADIFFRILKTVAKSSGQRLKGVKKPGCE